MSKIKIDQFEIVPSKGYLSLEQFLSMVEISKDHLLKYVDFKISNGLRIIRSSKHDFHNSKTVVAVVEEGRNISDYSDNIKDSIILLNKLSLEEWQNKFISFKPNPFICLRPSFYFTKTKRGIITSTYPISRCVYDYYKNGYIYNFSHAKSKDLIFSDTEFIFIPFKKTHLLFFEYGQALPVFKDSSKLLNFSPSDFFEVKDVFWGNEFYTKDIYNLCDYHLLPINEEIDIKIWNTYYKEYNNWLNDDKTKQVFSKLHDDFDEWLDNKLFGQNENNQDDDWMDEPNNYWNID